MHGNNDLIGQCLSNDRQIFNEHVFFNGGGERRGTNGWFPALSAGCRFELVGYNHGTLNN